MELPALPTTDSPAPAGTRAGRAGIAAVLALFFAALLPYAGNFLLYYPDEKHYTDGGQQMLTTGDWLVPRTAEGRPRLLKPVLPYWLTAASYRLLGVSPFTSRLPFLLAGAFTLCLVWELARRLTGDPRAATLAAAIALAQVQVLLASLRSMPDILNTVFVTMSAVGFLDLLTARTPRRSSPWLAYLGVGLVLASKGLLGLAFGAYAWAAVLTLLGWRAGWARLFHPPAMLAGLALAAAWYAAVLGQLGPAALEGFWSDQFQGKVRIQTLSPLHRVPSYVGVLILNALPFSPMALEALLRDRGLVRRWPPPLRRAAVFVLGWALACCVIFGLGKRLSPRYLLPAGPLLAVLLAMVLHSALPEVRQRIARGWLAIMVGVLGLTGAAGAILLWQWSSPAVAVALGAAYGLAGAVLLWGVRRGRWSALVAAAAVAPVVLGLGFAVLAGPFLPDTPSILAAALQGVPEVSRRTINVVGDEALASRLRLVSGGVWRVRAVETLAECRPEAGQLVVVPQRGVRPLDLAGWSAGRVAAGYEGIRLDRAGDRGALLEAVGAGRLRPHLEDHRRWHLILEPTLQPRATQPALPDP